MSIVLFAGIFGIGFVFGYLLYYAVRHTANFNIELLSSAIGTIGSGTVIGFLGKADGWLGPYGIGIMAGFLFYLVLTILLSASGEFGRVVGSRVLFLSQKLLGFTPK